MSRDGGFPTADLDVGFLDDAKVRALVRANRDEGLVARALLAYLATVLQSWADGDRVPLREAAPIWLTGLEDLEERLREAELVDDGGQILEHAFRSWFGAAAHRRDDRRFEGMVGGLMRSLGLDRKTAEVEARRRLASARQVAVTSTSGGPTSDLTRSDSSPSVPSRLTEPLPTEPAQASATVARVEPLPGRVANGHGHPFGNGKNGKRNGGERLTDYDAPMVDDDDPTCRACGLPVAEFFAASPSGEGRSWHRACPRTEVPPQPDAGGTFLDSGAQA